MRRHNGEGDARIDLSPLAPPLLRIAALWTVRRGAFYGPHVRTHFEINYTHTGNQIWELEDGSRLRVRGGDLALIQPNCRHRFLRDTITPSEGLALAVKPHPPIRCRPFLSAGQRTRALAVLRSAGNCVVRAGRETEAAYLALRAAASKAATEGPDSLERLWLGTLLEVTVVAILRSIAGPHLTPRYRAVEAACRFIEDHLSERIGGRQIARAAGLSLVRLHTLFHEQVGESPLDYQIRLRLEAAEVALHDPGESVTAIAHRLGFCDSAHFDRRFKQHFGQSPSAWRRQASAEKRGARSAW